MEQFERCTHKRLIVLTNFNNDVMIAIQKLVLPSDLEVNFEIK